MEEVNGGSGWIKDGYWSPKALDTISNVRFLLG